VQKTPLESSPSSIICWMCQAFIYWWVIGDNSYLEPSITRTFACECVGHLFRIHGTWAHMTDVCHTNSLIVLIEGIIGRCDVSIHTPFELDGVTT
jgi:hypothetical protein